MPGTKVKDVGGRPLKLQVGVKKCWVLIPFQGLHPEKNRVQKDVCTPVFFPGESQGQRSLVGFRLWGRTE